MALVFLCLCCLLASRISLDLLNKIFISNIIVISYHLTKMVELPLSIRTEGNKIEIVNQLLLPHVVEYVPINSIEEAHDAIKTMKVHIISFYYFLINLTRSRTD